MSSDVKRSPTIFCRLIGIALSDVRLLTFSQQAISQVQHFQINKHSANNSNHAYQEYLGQVLRIIGNYLQRKQHYNHF